MKKFIYALLIAALPGLTMAAGGGYHLEKAPIDLHDKESLRNGAKVFVKYCLSCHSANYMRFNRMGKDLEISEDELKSDYMFVADKVGSTMSIAMNKDDSKEWFGNPPPDLSVLARARGADWLYTYFTTFYVDKKRPFGVNNAVFPDVGMPHVLWELEGFKEAKFDEKHKITGFEPATGGSMSAEEYAKTAADLTNFMVYMGEPIRVERERMGWWVLSFIFVFTVLAYLLKKEYWRDVH